MYNFRLRHSVPGLVKHGTNFPKFAVSPENLVTSQTAFVAPCWFPYSAFLEVTLAGPSSGLSPHTCGPPACARGVTAPSDLRTAEWHTGRTAEWHTGRPPRLSYPQRNAPPPEKPPRRGPRVLRHTRRDARRPGGPQAPLPNPYSGDTRGAQPSPGPRTSERAWARWPGEGGQKGEGAPFLTWPRGAASQPNPGRQQDGAGGGPGEAERRGPPPEPVRIFVAAGNAPAAGGGGAAPGSALLLLSLSPHRAAPPAGRDAPFGWTSRFYHFSPSQSPSPVPLGLSQVTAVGSPEPFPWRAVEKGRSPGRPGAASPPLIYLTSSLR